MHRSDRKERLLAIMTDLAAAQAVEDVAELITGEICASLDARSAGIWSVDAGARTATAIRRAGRVDDAAALPDEMAIDARHPIGAAIEAGEMWASSFACLPFVIEGRVVAVLYATFDDERELGDDERLCLRLLARQGALALDRARLAGLARASHARARRAAEQRGRLLAVTAELSRAATVSEVAAIVVDRGMSAMGANTGVLWMIDPTGRYVEMVRPLAYPEEVLAPFLKISLEATHQPVVRTIREGETFWVESMEEYRRRFPELESTMRPHRVLPIEASACVPISTGERTFGALSLTFPEPRRDEGEDRDFLLLLARHCALALERVEAEVERAEIHRALARSAERMRSLIDLGRRIDAAGLDRDAILSTVARNVGEVLGDLCVIRVASVDGSFLPVASVHHRDPEARAFAATLLDEPYRDTEGLTSQIYATGRALCIPDLGREEALYRLRRAYHPWIARYGAHSLLMVPMHARGRVVGTIMVIRDAPGRPYMGEDEVLLAQIAERAALALEHGLVYEAELRARREAESVSRAKDEFLTTLSHELRTPLTSILGWSSILRTRRSDPAAIERGLAIIERNANTQARLVEDMLNVGRIIAGKLRLDRRAIDPADAVRAALDALRPSAEAKGVLVEARIAPEIGPIIADPERLQQITWNLLSNAVKFTPKGGRVDLSLARRGEASVELRVKDTGQGISAEFLPHVFDRFRQGDASLTRTHGGLGLGLSIAKQLVELHGGTITAASAGAGRGATFIVTLPKDDPAQAPAEPPSLDEEPRSGGPSRLPGLRVLLVDDDRDTLDVVAMVLREHAAEVVEACSAAEALAALERRAFDVLVSDIGMPDEDGYMLLQKARALVAKQRRELPALALTAYAGAQDASMAREAGFQMHVGKPVSPAQIVDAVGRLAEGRIRY